MSRRAITLTRAAWLSGLGTSGRVAVLIESSRELTELARRRVVRSDPSACTELVRQALAASPVPLRVGDLTRATGCDRRRIGSVLAKLCDRGEVQAIGPRYAQAYQLAARVVACVASFPDASRREVQALASARAPVCVLTDSALAAGQWYVVRAPLPGERTAPNATSEDTAA
ncbi:MAG: hypothetical protein RIQ53_3301 [Pseudomonadota bacterium]|jgi:hypothetical protein